MRQHSGRTSHLKQGRNYPPQASCAPYGILRFPAALPVHRTLASSSVIFSRKLLRPGKRQAPFLPVTSH
ncbi:hypothetical protein CXU03_02330 [Akkermansia muciniphila]|nr:hypothetical protein CXU03_02330 [Akkermansia muciniphila]